jgi:hypothetical protein
MAQWRNGSTARRLNGSMAQGLNGKNSKFRYTFAPLRLMP